MGIVDAIVDLVSSGTTLGENNLKEIAGGVILQIQRYILESKKLSGENFLDWEKNLGIFLDCERKLYILETNPPKTPKANAHVSELTSFKKYEDDARDVKCIIMASMTAELQRLHADMEARHTMLKRPITGSPQKLGICMKLDIRLREKSSLRNIISVICLDKVGFSINVKDKCLSIFRNDIYYATAKMTNGLYILDLDATVYNVDVKRSKPNSLNLTYLWHCRLGHINEKRISKLRHSGVLDSFDLESYDVCQSCLLISRNIISVSCLDKAGFSINVKDKCLSVFRNDIYYATAKMTNGLYILDLDATVYNVDVKRSKPNSLNLTYLWHCRLGHINEKRISKLRHSGVLDSFDLESYDVFQSCLLAAHTLNCVPSKAVESTSYELWRGTKPNLSYLRIWGCDVYVRRLMTSGKLDSKSDRCKFVGYPKETKGYEFYHLADNKIFVARNGTFLEEFLSAISSGRKVDLEEIREPQEEISIAVEPERQDLVSQPAQVLPRRSDRMRNPPLRYGFLVSDEAVKNILKYLRNTKDAFLVYEGEEEPKVVGYTDASFQTDRDDYKSQAGYVFCLNGGAFSWKSSKQDTTADSITEAEYMAAAEATKEGVWIKKFISELGVVPSINDPIPLFCDNTGAIAQAKEPRSHQKTKHDVITSYEKS
ncbi:unnamed protein product [Cuscuta campestris]|uniref:ATP phosphoribosyltransferase n=1 Tax=Cuscuta campestris TaxID=132261 RepID=A0A484M939_9ASTE|nr:unnamed protein product [Cuscuta campestris]